MYAESELQKELEGVRKQLADYDALKQREEALTGALALLNGKSTTRPARAASPRTGTRRKRGGPIDPDAIIHAIHTYGEPAPASYINEQLGGVSSNRLSIALRKLVDDGKLKKKGERRATRYTPVG